MTGKSRKFRIWLPKKLIQVLDRQAKKKGVTRDKLVERAMVNWFILHGYERLLGKKILNG